MGDIILYDRESQRYELEPVMGDKFLKIMYDTAAGKYIRKPVVLNTFASRLYGKYADLKISKPLIRKMIKDLKIDVTEYNEGFNTLNSFFARKKTNIAFDVDQEALISPCDANMVAWENIDKDTVIQAKNQAYSLTDLLKSEKLANEFQGGTCIRLRLSPYHYHRAHFFDDTIIVSARKVKGSLHSVNPMALSNVRNLLCENKRIINVLKTKTFDEVALVEIGALFVGSIVHTASIAKSYKRGNELSYFKFGGSMVVLLFKKDTIVIDEDILLQTKLGYESKVKVGEKIGRCYYEHTKKSI